MVDGLAGEGDNPDLCHLHRGLFDAAAEAQNLATLRGVLHHLWNMVLDIGRASTQESSNIHSRAGWAGNQRKPQGKADWLRREVGAGLGIDCRQRSVSIDQSVLHPCFPLDITHHCLLPCQ